jgi:small subunit ribosomal protein S33
VQEVPAGHANKVPRTEGILIGVKMSSAGAKLYNYGRALRSQSEYARRMRFVSASIFGDLKRPTDKQTLRVATMMQRKPYEERKEIVQYYPAHEETSKLMRRLRYYGLYRDEHADFKEEMERLRQIRGKSKNRKRKDDYDIVEEDE